MEKFLNFVTEYYLVFTIVSIILILSLIGYIAEKSSSKDFKIKPVKVKRHNSSKTNAVEENSSNNIDSL